MGTLVLASASTPSTPMTHCPVTMQTMFNGFLLVDYMVLHETCLPVCGSSAGVRCGAMDGSMIEGARNKGSVEGAARAVV